MAENDAAKEGGEEIQVGNRSKVPFILGAIAVLIIGIGLGWAVTLLTAASDPAADDPAATEKAAEGEQGSQEVTSEMTNLGSFTVNLRDSAGGRGSLESDFCRGGHGVLQRERSKQFTSASSLEAEGKD
mgnify:CR=1 FL=1